MLGGCKNKDIGPSGVRALPVAAGTNVVAPIVGIFSSSSSLFSLPLLLFSQTGFSYCIVLYCIYFLTKLSIVQEYFYHIVRLYSIRWWTRL